MSVIGGLTVAVLLIQATNCDRFLCETKIAKFFRRQARLCDTEFYDTYFYDSLFLRQARLCDTHFYDKHVCATVFSATRFFVRQAIKFFYGERGAAPRTTVNQFAIICNNSLRAIYYELVVER